MSDDATVIMLRPGPNHAFCRRNPAAQVWTPVADGTVVRCACQDSMAVSRCQAQLEVYELGLKYRNGDMADVIELPPTKRLCELATGDVGELSVESEGE